MIDIKNLLHAGAGHDPLLKMTSFDANPGKMLHILKTGRYPNCKGVVTIDDDMWRNWFKRTITECTITRADRYDSSEAIDNKNISREQAFHTSEGITVFCNRDSGYANVYFDHTVAPELVDWWYDQVLSLKKVPSEKEPETKIGYLGKGKWETYTVIHSEYKPFEVDLIDHMDESVQQLKTYMRSQLESDQSSGLFLLHGEPGTGKTAFIKSLIEGISKQVIYIPPGYINNLTSVDFIDFLMSHPNSILVIEDAETALMKRMADNSNAVSNLLNITDGFPADVLNMNVICTFNTPINQIDPALLRKGRLKAVYEFKKLSITAGRKIAGILEINTQVNQEMTLAELCNLDAPFQVMSSSSVGF